MQPNISEVASISLLAWAEISAWIGRATNDAASKAAAVTSMALNRLHRLSIFMCLSLGLELYEADSRVAGNARQPFPPVACPDAE